ncbi:hypothetical protein [Piscirickettsia salmonis]
MSRHKCTKEIYEILPQCDYQHITYTMPAALWSFFKANAASQGVQSTG